MKNYKLFVAVLALVTCAPLSKAGTGGNLVTDLDRQIVYSSDIAGIAVSELNRRFVNKNGSDVVGCGTQASPCLSVKYANDLITNASITNPYSIEISPGLYSEDPAILLKSHIYYRGYGREATQVKRSDNKEILTTGTGRFYFDNIKFTSGLNVSFTASGDNRVIANRLQVVGSAGTSVVETVADVAGSLAGKYILVDGGYLNYYIWFKVSGVGTDPAVAGRFGIQVNISTDATATAVATAMINRMGATIQGEPHINAQFFAGPVSGQPTRVSFGQVGGLEVAQPDITNAGFTLISHTTGWGLRIQTTVGSVSLDIIDLDTRFSANAYFKNCTGFIKESSIVTGFHHVTTGGPALIMTDTRYNGFGKTGAGAVTIEGVIQGAVLPGLFYIGTTGTLTASGTPQNLPVVFTATTTSGSDLVTASSLSKPNEGTLLSGPGIAAGTTVLASDDLASGTFKISANATANGTAVTLEGSRKHLFYGATEARMVYNNSGYTLSPFTAKTASHWTTAPTDIRTSLNNLALEKFVQVTGTRAAPTLVSATPAITLTANASFQKQYVQGNAGPITVTANPAIPVGTKDGQELELVGRSDVDTVTYTNGNGLSLNGDVILGADDSIRLSWDGTNWSEQSRR